MASIRIRPSSKQFWAEHTIVVCIMLALLLMSIYCFIWQPFFAVIPTALLFSLLLYILYLWLYFRSQVWIIRQEEIVQQVGIISMVTDYIEMYRIVDYQERQGFLQRLLGIKTIILISTDRLNSTLLLKGIPINSSLTSIIRKRVEICKTNNRIYEITNP